jgi:hypothetical protein
MLKKNLLCLGLILLVFCAAHLLSANPTDQAIERIRGCTRTAIAEIQELVAGVERIRTVAEALESLERYYAIVTRMVNEINSIDRELGANVDTRRLHASLDEIKRQTQAIGQVYGTALGKLPQAILGADEFVAALQKLKDLGM